MLNVCHIRSGIIGNGGFHLVCFAVSAWCLAIVVLARLGQWCFLHWLGCDGLSVPISLEVVSSGV